MRLSRLHLERYGHFTDKVVRFREDACLHVVHGANEAGKTCSLAAITDLFFKFEQNSEWDFLHPGKLSLGGTIVGDDGQALSFRRRKGTKYTLLDDVGGQLSENALDFYLGALTRETFSRAFGLSAKRLRKGAKEMLKSGGEVGASLFAAASGLRGLSEMRTRLNADASAIFTPNRGQTRTFYQALKRYEDAAKAIREQEFKERDLKERTARVDTLEQHLQQIREKRKTDELSRERLERLREVAPLLSTITRLESSLQIWEGFPALDPGELTRLRSAWSEVERADCEVEKLLKEQEAARRYAETFTVERALLSEAAVIQSLLGQTGAYTEKKGQISGVRTEGDRLRRELETMRLRLELPVEVDLASMQPGDAAVSRARRLLFEGRNLRQARRSGELSLQKEREELERLASQRQSAGAMTDPAPFRQRLDAIMPALGRLQELERIDRAVKLEEGLLVEAGRQMSPAIIDLNQLARASLPEALAIQQFAAELEGHGQAIGPLERRIQETAAAIRSGEERQERFEASTPVASPERIAGERQRRMQAWQPLRGVLLGDGGSPAPAALACLLISFETSMAEADRLADQAIRDAERLEAYLSNQRQLGEDEQKANNQEAELQHAREAEAEGQRRWAACWPDLVPQPQAPGVMLLWLAEVRRMLGRRKSLLENVQQAERLQAEIVGVRPILDGILSGLGNAEARMLSTKLALTSAETLLGEKERLWKLAGELVILETNANRRLGSLQDAEAAGELRSQAWQAEWQDVLPSLHLTAEADCDEAEAVLALWQLVPDKTDALAVSARRVSGMQRDMKTMEEQTFALLSRLGETKNGADADVAVKLLVGRLTTASNQQTAQREAERQSSLLAGKVTDAEALSASHHSRFVQLSAVLPPAEDVAAQLESLEQRAITTRDLAKQREVLGSLARNQSEEELRAFLREFDEVEATATVNELHRKDEASNREENDTFADLKDARRVLTQLQSGAGAEFSLQQKRNAEAELLEQTHDWAIKRLGQILLARAVETHRSRQEQPLLRRASELFNMLTAGSSLSIEQEADEASDEEMVRLVGRRDAGRTVCLSAMSTGTRDQFYLALRLAFLEQYAASTESVPFIGDDLFTSSDERRTAQGLKALAATGHRIQPILFTHHAHVVELACRELGESVDVIVLEA